MEVQKLLEGQVNLKQIYTFVERTTEEKIVEFYENYKYYLIKEENRAKTQFGRSGLEKIKVQYWEVWENMGRTYTTKEN